MDMVARWAGKGNHVRAVRKMAMKPSTLHPPAYFLTALLAMIALHFLMPISAIIPTPWTSLGTLPLTAGVVISVIADRAFKRAGTTVRPFEVSTVLITSGPFQMSRNPMYLGFVLVLCGVAVLLGNLSPFAVIAVFSMLIRRKFIAAEERMLADQFGAAWRDYAARTGRWI